jgi:hypothetical protein
MNYDHVIGKQIEITQIIEAIEDTYMNLGGTTYRIGASILNIIGVDNNSIHLSLEHICRAVYEYSLSESMFALCETIAEIIYYFQTHLDSLGDGDVPVYICERVFEHLTYVNEYTFSRI